MIVERPFSFHDIVGQPQFVKEMKRRSRSIDFPSVIFMEGDSGSGKSTSAFIIAGLLNCENPITDDMGVKTPCGQCAACKDIVEERFQRDIHFFDGSNMGKEDVVQLEQLASSVPFHDDNKIIIIDEAQELSKKGFGATLKLLEKKRKNTYFILCTMDRKAITKSVKDRGQSYRFWPVDTDAIAEYLFRLVKDRDDIPDSFFQEGVFLISEYSGGSVRAALQNLERCIYGELYDKESIEQELGFISPGTLSNLILLLLEGSPDFFKKLKENNESIEEFYNKSWTALLEAKLAQAGAISPSSIPEWKKKYHAEYLKQEKFVDKLLKTYEEIFESGKYLKSDYFLYKLYREMIDVPSVNRSQSPSQQTDVRRTRRRKSN